MYLSQIKGSYSNMTESYSTKRETTKLRAVN